MNKNNAALILSPNMGYLDMGLPLMNFLKESHFNTTLIVPYEIIPRGINISDTLITFLPEIINNFIIVFSKGNQKKINNFKDFKKFLVLIKNLRFFDKKIRLIEKAFSFLSNKSYENIDLPYFDFIVFDITVLNRKNLTNFFHQFSRNSEWLSYHHAIKIHTPQDSNENPEYKNEFHSIYTNTNLLTLSQHENKYWLNKLNGKVEKIVPVGILRHQQSWILKIQSSTVHEYENHVLLITRPKISLYLKEEDKIEALKDILMLQKNLNLAKIIIRLHPKETEKKLYFKIFGKDNYKKSWEFTDLHPFIASKKALMCICLSHSNVIYDMNVLNIPVIIRKNIKTYNEYYHRKTSEPIVNLGMVNLTKNYFELYNETKKIIAERENYIIKQNSAYNAYFEKPNNLDSILDIM